MKHYVCVTDINGLEKIHNDFKSIFKVDLDDKKYSSYSSVEERWNAIIDDTFLRCSEMDKESYTQKFVEVLSRVLYGEQSICVEIDEIADKKRKNAIECFKEFIGELQTCLDDYRLYEPDVWLNAYLSIKYIRARGAEEGSTRGCVYISPPHYVNAKNHKYKIPFEKEQDDFCVEYMKKLLGKDDVQILGADINPEEKKYECADGEEGFQGYKKRVQLSWKPGMKCNRWSRGKVWKLERSKNFEIEDRIMFHKTINGVLVRNLVDTMISTGCIYDVEDYLYLLEKLCMFKSMNWQNLIGCLYIYVSQFKRELKVFDRHGNLWGDIEVIFEAFFMNMPAINRRLEVLVGGLTYIIYRQDAYFSNMDDVKEKCRSSLEEIEKQPIPFSERAKELINNEWEKANEDMRYLEAVKKDHRQFKWIYVIMKRYVINCLTPYKCERLRRRDRDWSYLIISIASYNSLVKRGKPSMHLSGRKTDAPAEECEKVLNIAEICSALQQEGKATKKELFNEVKRRLKEMGIEDEKGKILNRTLENVYYRLVDIKAMEKHIHMRSDDSMDILKGWE